MPKKNRLTAFQRAAAIERIADGESYGSVARSMGVTAQAIRYHCRATGVESRHPPSERRVTIEGRTRLLCEWARDHGLGISTLHMRLAAGERGPRLLRPAQHHPPPPVYRFDLPLARWREYGDLGHAIGARNAARKTGLPAGAIGAAMRGEWERLA